MRILRLWLFQQIEWLHKVKTQKKEKKKRTRQLTRVVLLLGRLTLASQHSSLATRVILWGLKKNSCKVKTQINNKDRIEKQKKRETWTKLKTNNKSNKDWVRHRLLLQKKKYTISIWRMATMKSSTQTLLRSSQSKASNCWNKASLSHKRKHLESSKTKTSHKRT